MERITDTRDREYKIKHRNEQAKQMAKNITRNLYTYLCIAIPILLIGTIWTEFTLPSLGWGLMGDGILTVALFVIGERLAVEIGSFGGKLDEEYLTAKARYAEAAKGAKARGIPMLTPFCEWQVDVEFERARRARCSRLRIKYETYTAEYEGKTLEELKRIMPIEKAIQVDRINKMEPIVLTADMLLFTGNGHDRREITISGDEYKDKKIYGRKGLIISIVTCVICVGLPLAFIGGTTLSKVVYTFGKFAVLLFRMFKGYSDGAKAYHTIEVRHLNSKSEYLEEYADFYDKKIYLTIASEYTQINRILGLNCPGNGDDNVKISCIEPYEEGAGGGHRGSEPDGTPVEDHPGAEPGGEERRGDHDGSLHIQ